MSPSTGSHRIGHAHSLIVALFASCSDMLTQQGALAAFGPEPWPCLSQYRGGGQLSCPLLVLQRTCPPPGALRNGLLAVIFVLSALSFTFGGDPQDAAQPAASLRVPPISSGATRLHQSLGGGGGGGRTDLVRLCGPLWGRLKGRAAVRGRKWVWLSAGDVIRVYPPV